jgi:hypothetical protein
MNAARDRVIAECALKRSPDGCAATSPKGYRQRVGLAQALAPASVLVSTPTIELDPALIIEIRQLIRTLTSSAPCDPLDASCRKSHRSVESRSSTKGRVALGRIAALTAQAR